MRIRLQQATPEHAGDACAARSTRRLQRLHSPLAMPLVPLAPVVAALQVTSLLLTDEAGVHAAVSGRLNGTGRTISCSSAIARRSLGWFASDSFIHVVNRSRFLAFIPLAHEISVLQT